ncbi:MAG: tetratricopeptide repeat protein [Planctomycetota bacterium]
MLDARLLFVVPIALFAVGCASAQKFAGSFRSTPATQVAAAEPDARAGLKDPTRVDLSYAGYQAQLGNIDEARAAYGRVLDSDDESLAALLGLARLDELAGRTEEAERSFRRAVEIAPEDPRCLAAVGNFYANQGRHLDAIPLYERSLLLAPDDKTVSYSLGLALARTDRPDAALPHLSVAIGDAAAHYNIGYLAFERGQIARAEKAFLQASILDPDLGDAVVMLDEVRRIDESQGLIARQRPAATAVRQVSATVEPAGTAVPAVSSSAAPVAGHPLLGRGYRGKLTPQQLQQLQNQRR